MSLRPVIPDPGSCSTWNESGKRIKRAFGVRCFVPRGTSNSGTAAKLTCSTWNLSRIRQRWMKTIPQKFNLFHVKQLAPQNLLC
jgi:hypothetical protein